MAGKATVFADRDLFRVMDELSKNQLIDLVVDMIRGEMADDVSNEAILCKLQPRLDTVWRYRNDKRRDMVTLYHTRKNSAAEYLRKMNERRALEAKPPLGEF